MFDVTLFEQQLRNCARDKALSLVGLGYGEGPEKRAAYEAELWPFDSAEDAASQARLQSSCTLTQECVLRALGIDDDRFYQPYARRVARGGVLYAGALLVDVAAKVGALTDCRQWRGAPDGVLDEGDMLIIGQNNGGPAWGRGSFSGTEHGLTVVSIEGDTMVTVEGGQPSIEQKTRKVVVVDGELWVCAPDAPLASDGRPSHGRRARWLIHLTALPFRDDAEVASEADQSESSP